MPGYKKSRFRKNRSSRRSYRRGGGSSTWARWYQKGITPKESLEYAVQGVKYLSGLVNSEMFKLDTAFSAAALTTGAVSHVTAVQQGDGDSQRTGNSIFVRSYNLKGSIVHNAAGSNTQFVRVSVVQDKQQIGDTVPAYTDVYESASPYAHLNSNTVGRFKILYSRTYIVNNNDKTSCLLNINIPMRHHVRYNGTAGSDIQKGGLYICTSVDEPTANMPTWSGEMRLSYHDN